MTEVEWEEKPGFVVDVNAPTPVDLFGYGLKLGSLTQWECPIGVELGSHAKLVVGVRDGGTIIYVGQEYTTQVVDQVGKYRVSLGSGQVRERYIFDEAGHCKKATSRTFLDNQSDFPICFDGEKQITSYNIITLSKERALRELEKIDSRIKPSLDRIIQEIKPRQMVGQN